MIDRRILGPIQSDLKKKMVLLAGPRQCGKTTLTRELVDAQSNQYLNWDIAKDRKTIRDSAFDFSKSIWAFDEIHKFKKWKNYLKGLYDEHGRKHSILVTGSAKLEVYGRGGDSLQGRYFSHHLHPLTASEVLGLPYHGVDTLLALDGKVPAAITEALSSLLIYGGFPEPFLSQNVREAARWRDQYGQRLVEEDVRSLENVRSLDSLELLLDRLSSVAGGILSINSLREDLDVAFETARNWVAIFERLYAIFRILPYGPPKIKAVKKEPKLYFWDWARADSEGARLENMVAVHLLRWVHWLRDVEGEKIELRYFRTREGHEVDFILLKKGVPWIAIEVKSTESTLAPGLKYLLERVSVPHAFQVVHHLKQERELVPIRNGRVHLVSLGRFLSLLP